MTSQRISSSKFDDGSARTVSEALTDRLFDPKLIQRYGTSIRENMGREYEHYLDKRYATLEKEFARINKDSDDHISFNELYEFIDSYERETGETLDKGYCERLFDLIDMDQNKKISIKEFIMSYMILEEKIRLKKIKLTKLQEEINTMKDKYHTEREKNRNETLNQHGVSEEACLNVTIIEARDLKPMDFNGKSDPYCVLKFDGQQQTTAYKPNTLNPYWGEEFSL